MKQKTAKKVLSLALAFVMLSAAHYVTALATDVQAALKHEFGFMWDNNISPKQYYLGEKMTGTTMAQTALTLGN